MDAIWSDALLRVAMEATGSQLISCDLSEATCEGDGGTEKDIAIGVDLYMGAEKAGSSQAKRPNRLLGRRGF
ncbi:unnamed protein product [Chondrus crispus]|uniref:Uncharacterized protein n=1 Tax=Chondrus crispus TaxID=2769 RepID=R7Q210_CHOCR|nr:unnamed protein product [Chondrus crispus]CDF32622.1 unnamed protein product [Chondrus crispus]|eukprot:XP_005712393.1 unnamed protein product [Chondrus crispus]